MSTIVISSDESEDNDSVKYPRLSYWTSDCLASDASTKERLKRKTLHNDSSSSSESEFESDTFSPSTVKTVKSPVKKRQPTVRDKPQKFLHDLSTLPIYCQSSKQLSTIQCVNILLDPELSSDSLCSRVPFDVNCNSVFVIDMSILSDPKDVVCDDMGVWRWKGSYRRWLCVDETGYIETIGKTLKKVPDIPCYRIWKRYYENKSSRDLNKVVVTMEDAENDTLNLALIQYTFIYEEHTIKVAPHGNSVKSESYIRTMPSVMNKLKDASSNNTAKRTLSFVTNDITTAHSAGAMPRGRQQVNDIRKKMTTTTDPLFTLMMMCKEGEGSKSPDAFVRIVTGAPFPMMMLAFDWTLEDLVRFCTSSSSFSILGIDPTFSLGAFDVTVTTYRHLLLTTKDDQHKHPVLIGPLFIHVKKDFQTYHFFASSLVSKKPELAELQCFGTDGESALVKAFSAVFTKAMHLRCFLHFRQNIEHKLQELGVSSSVIKEYRKDIFGDPQCLQLGLVDASTKSELKKKINSLEKKWNNLEKPFHSPPEFYEWFQEHSMEVIANCMIRPLREQAGLGSPPTPYYTNDIESKNNILKQYVQRKASQLPEFVEYMKALITEQRSEIEKAVAMYGEYRVVSSHSNLACERQKWFKMSEKQRHNKISRFMKAPIVPLSHGDSVNEDVEKQVTPLDCLSLPPNMAKTIWSRANAILEDESAIVKAPGDEAAYVVRSVSGQKPHYVRPAKGGGYLCDDCLGYKSAKICAHTVAASVKSGKIDLFINYYKKLKCQPNFTVLAESGKPSTSGKKQARKGVSKRVSRHIQATIDEADEEDFSSRVHVPSDDDDPLPSEAPSIPISTLPLDEQLLGPPPPLISDNLMASSTCVSTMIDNNAPPAVSTSQTGSRQAVGEGSDGAVMSPQFLFPSSSVQVPVNNYGYFTNYGYQRFGQSNCFSPPLPPPPPLVPYDSPCSSATFQSMFVSPVQQDKLPSVNVLFWICFVKGNISRCNGCKNKIGRLPPPEDIVLQHKERVLFLNPHTGVYQLSRDCRNVYYHARNAYVYPHFNDFCADIHIKVDRSVQLSGVHVQHMLNEFNVDL